jgi:hypothetical protein
MNDARRGQRIAERTARPEFAYASVDLDAPETSTAAFATTG